MASAPVAVRSYLPQLPARFNPLHRLCVRLRHEISRPRQLLVNPLMMPPLVAPHKKPTYPINIPPAYLPKLVRGQCLPLLPIGHHRQQISSVLPYAKANRVRHVVTYIQRHPDSCFHVRIFKVLLTHAANTPHGRGEVAGTSGAQSGRNLISCSHPNPTPNQPIVKQPVVQPVVNTTTIYGRNTHILGFTHIICRQPTQSTTTMKPSFPKMKSG